ncbi:uncharacterized protein BDV17DRAFT_293236 [Aspergillus undulatus]|uniref:uncharacterized protein n=1 Tax=Aspergillus undulatus TaxID=1810928 RepID=UPI003CCD2612
MSGINDAARYQAAGMPRDSANWPFLALYPVPDIEFLQSEEFINVPLTNFDIRQYRTLVKSDDAGLKDGPASNILLVEFDGPTQDLDLERAKSILLESSNFLTRSVPQRVTIYEAIWALLYRGEKFKELPRYLATFEFDDDEDLYREAAEAIEPFAAVRWWKLHRTFGQTSTT